MFELRKTDLNMTGNRYFDVLFQEIHNMQAYGTKLSRQEISKGQIIEALSLRLKAKLLAFHYNYQENKTITQEQYDQLKANFETEINKVSKELHQFRTDWSRVVLNVLVDLTGVGLLVIAANMAYTKLNHGHAALLFQPAKTHSANSVEKIMACSSMPALAAG